MLARFFGSKEKPVQRMTTRKLFVIFGVCAGLAAILFAQPAWAAGDTIGSMAIRAFGAVIEAIVSIVGKLLLVCVSVLIDIAQYNGFVSAPAVANGWVIVRDLTNMFFILVLLVLAFGTMLGVDEYSYKNKMFSRLLIMAVVINFSRTIAGLFIDLSQVIMLTFVNGFAAAAGGNFTQALQIDKLMNINQDAPGDVDTFSAVGALFLALVMVTISLIVVLVMAIALVMRIVLLWLLVVMSPLAFFMKAVPGGKASAYYAQWWDEFTKNLLTGPVLAFFLWLALVTVATGDITVASSDSGANCGVGAACSSANIQAFLIGIGMLMGGLYFAEKIGGVGAGVAGKARGKITDFGKAAASFAARTAVKAPLKLAGAALQNAPRAFGGATLSAYGNVAWDKVKKSGAGRLVGLDAKYTEQKQIEMREKAERQIGSTTKADAIKTQNIQSIAGALEKDGVTGETLEKMYKEVSASNPGSRDHQALSLRMAQEGKLKNTEIAAINKGDKVLGGMLIGAAGKGDPLAALAAAETPEERTRIAEAKLTAASEGERNKMVLAATQGAYKGVDGSVKNAFAGDVLQAIDPSAFKKMPDALQAKVLDSMNVAALNNPAQAKNLTEKREALYGGLDKAEDKARLLDTFNKKPQDMAAAQNAAVRSERPGLMQVSMAKAFPSISPKGNFGRDEDRADFSAMITDERTSKEVAQKMTADDLGRNGGVNEQTITIMTEMTPDNIAEMARDPAKKQQVEVLLKSADNLKHAGDKEAKTLVDDYKTTVISKTEKNLAVANFANNLDKTKLTPRQQQVEIEKFTATLPKNEFPTEQAAADAIANYETAIKAAIAKAQSNAQTIVTSARGQGANPNTPLRAAINDQKFTTKAGRFAVKAAKTVAVGGAVTAAGIAGGAVGGLAFGAGVAGAAAGAKIVKEVKRRLPRK